MDKIKKLAREISWKLEILDQQMLKKNGLNALLAVSQGSEHPPFLVIATYQHSTAKKILGLVGKGITFDTGGISIKAARSMEEMKYNMAGAIIGAIFLKSMINKTPWTHLDIAGTAYDMPEKVILRVVLLVLGLNCCSIGQIFCQKNEPLFGYSLFYK